MPNSGIASFGCLVENMTFTDTVATWQTNARGGMRANIDYLNFNLPAPVEINMQMPSAMGNSFMAHQVQVEWDRNTNLVGI